MAHKTDWTDVANAVGRYRDVTGDIAAELCIDGAFLRIEGRHAKLEAYGKGSFVHVIERFCDGWESGFIRGAGLEVTEEKVESTQT